MKEEQKMAAKAAATSLIPTIRTKRDQLIEMALSQVGTTEDAGNQVKYNFWFYGRQVKDGDHGPGYKYPWCCTFICWVFNQIGKKLPKADYNNGWSSVPNLYHYAANKSGMITEDPRPGDLVIYTWGGQITHIGFFMGWKLDPIKGRIEFKAVEGNTSFDEVGSQDNGGAVALKTRKIGLVKAFINVDNFLQ